jgi:hypothetical protein
MFERTFFCLFAPFSIFFYLILPSTNQDLNAAPKKQPKTQTSQKRERSFLQSTAQNKNQPLLTQNKTLFALLLSVRLLL